MALDISTPCYFVTLEIEEIYGRLKLASSHYLYLALNERFDFSAVLNILKWPLMSTLEMNCQGYLKLNEESLEMH